MGDTAFLPEQKTHIITFGALGGLAFDSAYDTGHMGDTAFLPEQKTHIITFGALGGLAFDSAYDIVGKKHV